MNFQPRIIKIEKALARALCWWIDSFGNQDSATPGGSSLLIAAVPKQIPPPPFYLERIATVAMCKPLFAQSLHLLQILKRSLMLIEFQRDRDPRSFSGATKSLIWNPLLAFAALCVRIFPLFRVSTRVSPRMHFTIAITSAIDPFLDNRCLTFDERNLETREHLTEWRSNTICWLYIRAE